MAFQKKINPEPNQIKQLRRMFKIGHSKSSIARTMDVSIHLIYKWITVLEIKRTNKCSWCGMVRVGKRVNKRWLCDQCNKIRCKHCSILLSQTRTDSLGNHYGSFYPKHPKYCKSCWDELHPNKNIDKTS